MLQAVMRREHVACCGSALDVPTSPGSIDVLMAAEHADVCAHVYSANAFVSCRCSLLRGRSTAQAPTHRPIRAAEVPPRARSAVPGGLTSELGDRAAGRPSSSCSACVQPSFPCMHPCSSSVHFLCFCF
jgi:hypothetical protein